MELPGKRKRGRPKWKRMDAMGEREDMAIAEVTKKPKVEEEAGFDE